MDAPGGKFETINLDLGCPAALEKAGVKVAFNTDDPITSSRYYSASGDGVRGGMSEESALKGLTIYPLKCSTWVIVSGRLIPGKTPIS